MRKPELKIEPTLIGEAPKWYTFQVLFPEPRAFEKPTYVSYMWTIMHDGEEKVLFEYQGLKNAFDELSPPLQANDTVSVLRSGTGKETRWRVERAAAPATEAVVRAAPMPSRYEPARPVEYHIPDMDTVIALGTIHLSFLERMLQEVEGVDAFKDVSLDQKIRLATGAIIHALREYRPGIIIPGPADEVIEEFLNLVRGQDISNHAKVVESVLNATLVMAPGFNDVKELKEALNAVGVSGADIDKEDPLTWVEIYNLAHQVGSLVESGTDMNEASAKVRQEYFQDEADDAPF